MTNVDMLEIQEVGTDYLLWEIGPLKWKPSVRANIDAG